MQAGIAGARMRAVEYDAYGDVSRLQIREVARPVPRAGEVLVRVHAAALNPKDALFRKGRFRLLSGRAFPKRSGLDFAGEVVESRTPDFAPGDRVFGAIDEFRFRRGTLAERVCARGGELARLPASVPYEAGASVALVGLTSLQALRDLGRVRAGSEVLIHGASGGVGTHAIQLAKRLGARVTTTSSARNLEHCRALGADEALDYATGEHLRTSTRFDCVYDVFGNLSLAKVRGLMKRRSVFVSTVPRAARVLKDLLTRLLPRHERLVVVRPDRADLELLARWLERGELLPVIDSRFPLERIHDAVRVIESKRARGKVVISIP